MQQVRLCFRRNPQVTDLVLVTLKVKTQVRTPVGLLGNRSPKVVETAAGESRFANGFKTMSPLLRQALTERHGRKVVDDGADAWLVEA
jgi:hypothetical protein